MTLGIVLGFLWLTIQDVLKYNEREKEGKGNNSMSYIVDKLILLLLSAVLLAGECSVKELIVLSLLGVISACINTYFDKKSIAVSAGILYLITILMVPKAVLMAGVILYDLYAHKLYVLEGVTGLLLVGLIGNVSVRSVIMLIVISLLAHLLFRRSRKLEGLELQLNKIRDDSYEKNLFLMDKNKHLIESQDQEVYVATLKERNRIAREIHDNVGHMLTRSILQMGALMTIYKEEPIHGQLESVKNNLDIAMNNIRESVHDLHDESIDLKASIEDLLNELRGNFACKLDYDISKTIDRKYKYAIIGIVREAVSNIIKHG